MTALPFPSRTTPDQRARSKAFAHRIAEARRAGLSSDEIAAEAGDYGVRITTAEDGVGLTDASSLGVGSATLSGALDAWRFSYPAANQ